VSMERGKRQPLRRATRSSASLRLVTETPRDVVETPQPSAASGDDGDDAPAELLAAVTSSLLAGIAAARTPLAAELALSSSFGIIQAGVADQADQEAAARMLLDQVVDHAEMTGGADEMAMLRVAAVVGPASTRARAAEAAERLAQAGVPDRPWATRVGRPRMLRAWQYGDVLGAQSSIGVLFDYQGRDHALMVLVDHMLGGGVKDCWVSEGRAARGLHDSIADAMAREPDTYFVDLDSAAAATALREALSNPPCPEQDDQVEDVGELLYLTRSRTEHLARLADLPPESEQLDPDATIGAGEILRIKISIRHTKPPIWRRLEVSETTTLATLHALIKGAFGWTDSHLHQFEVEDPVRGRRVVRDGATQRFTLASLVDPSGASVVYRYDFGDDWEHLIELEAREPALAGVAYPRCPAGRRADPPEDCGGPGGLAMILEALADPQQPDHEDLITWVPSGYDPAHFDRVAVEASLRRAWS